jgi:uncharacterized protein YndB with AHSA1/START domain
MIDDIEASIDISASLERVWGVLTGEGLIEQWLGCQRFKAEVGHVFYMQPDAAKRQAEDIAGATHCQIEAMEPPDTRRVQLVPAWPTQDDGRVDIGGDARWHAGKPGPHRLEPVRRGRRAGRPRALTGGWGGYCLPSLKRLSEAA